MAGTESFASASGELMRELAAALPAELAEVLLPTMRLRPAAGRLVAVFPNQVWRDVFRDHAAEHARRVLRARSLGLNLVCKQETSAAEGADEQRFENFLQDPGNQLAV